MKDVIYKLSIEDHGKNKEETMVLREPKENRSQKVTEDVRMELSAQMDANMRLKSTLKQAEKEAEEAKEEAEELKAEIAQLQSELIQLSNVQQLFEESQKKNKELQAMLEEVNKKTQKSQNQ